MSHLPLIMQCTDKALMTQTQYFSEWIGYGMARLFDNFETQHAI